LNEDIRWMDESACRSLSQEEKDRYIYPLEPHTKATREFVAELCGGCPVQEQCLQYAIRNRIGAEQQSRTIIFGGLDYRGRVAWMRKQATERRKGAKVAN